MSATPAEHKREAPRCVRCAAVTISDTRTWATDIGGMELVEHLTRAGHEIVAREIVPDDPARIRQLLTALSRRADIDAVLCTGGTGIADRDETFEIVSDMLTKPLPGYGELFRMLSFAEIGPAAMLSRAAGGLMGRTAIFTMPGSPAAVRLAMERIIVPELGHVIREARR